MTNDDHCGAENFVNTTFVQGGEEDQAPERIQQDNA